MPNQPSPELIPESIDAQLPSGTRLRFCFDEPLMTSDAGLLLLARHAGQCGDIERIAAALAPKLKAPAPGGRKPRAPAHSTAQLITQRVLQLIGGYPDGIDSNLLRHDPALQLLVGRAAPGTPEAVLASQPTMSRFDNAMRLLCSSLAYQLLDGFRRTALGGSHLARAAFGQVRMKLFKLAARVRVMKTRVEVHLARSHPGSELMSQVMAQNRRVKDPPSHQHRQPLPNRSPPRLLSPPRPLSDLS